MIQEKEIKGYLLGMEDVLSSWTWRSTQNSLCGTNVWVQ